MFNYLVVMYDIQITLIRFRYLLSDHLVLAWARLPHGDSRDIFAKGPQNVHKVSIQLAFPFRFPFIFVSESCFYVLYFLFRDIGM